MSFAKIVFFSSLLIFAGIGGIALVKKLVRPSSHAPVLQLAESLPPAPAKEEATTISLIQTPSEAHVALDELPEMDRVFQLFTTGPKKLPIIETVTYTSTVPWLKGRPAWIADYAAYFATSRHFIARSLNQKLDYFSQKVQTGSKFNVFRKDKPIHFYLVVDLSRCKMGFYYLDLTTEERVLLKTYPVALGKLDPHSPSGSLTPLGKYSLGQRIAVYQPGMVGKFYGTEREMVSVYGSRWIPFGDELEGGAKAKGFGIHGAPWELDSRSGQFIENRDAIGKHATNGSISLLNEDVEELFSIVITKPTYLVIVKHFREAKLPGVEVATPTR